jgi:hypothetical protein
MEALTQALLPRVTTPSLPNSFSVPRVRRGPSGAGLTLQGEARSQER